MGNNRVDFLMVAWLAAAGVAYTFIPHAPNIALAVFGVLLVLALPGYLISSVLLPGLSFVQQVTFSLGGSLFFNLVGGFLLNLSPWGLSTSTWAVWCGGFCMVGGLGLWIRNGSHPLNPPKIHLPILTAQTLVWSGLALAFLAGAVLVAQSAVGINDQPFTALGAKIITNPAPAVIQITVQNEEQQARSYRVTVDDEQGARLAIWNPVELENGRTWQAQLDLESLPAQTITISVYRSDVPDLIYRQTRIVYLTKP